MLASLLVHAWLLADSDVRLTRSTRSFPWLEQPARDPIVGRLLTRPAPTEADEPVRDAAVGQSVATPLPPAQRRRPDTTPTTPRPAVGAAADQPAPAQSAPSTEPLAERSSPPSQPLDDRDIRTIDQYRLSLAFAARRLLRTGMPTPTVARGRADIGLAIDAAGQLHAVRTVRSSGDAGLDDEAMALVRRGYAETPVPSLLAGRSFEIVLTVAFE